MSGYKFIKVLFFVMKGRSMMKLVENHKQRISSLLNEGIKNPIVLIEAPRGYSKRELIYQYVQDNEINFAWLRLRKMDNWMFFNWKHLLKELQGVLPEQEDEYTRLELPTTPGQIAEFVELLEKDLVNSRPVVMVIDDYSILEEEQVRLFYESLIESNIKNLHLIIISSQKTNIAGFCLKSNVGCFLIGEDELRLTPLETKRYFENNQVSLTYQQAEQITDKWKGWPMPILMLAKDHHDISELQESPLDKVQPLFFFHYFDRYSQRIKKILIRMSLLTEIPLELYDFLLDEGKKVIENNPLIYCDKVNGIFTLQIDYKNFLATRQVYLSEEEKIDTFKKAGEILIKREQFEAAIPLLIQGKDYDKAVELVWDMLNQFMDFSKLRFIQQQINQLPDDYLATHPRAVIQRASMLIFLGEPVKSEEILLSLIEDFKAGKITDNEVAGEVYYLLFQLARSRGVKDIGDYARLASEYLPKGSRYWGDPVSILIKALRVRFPLYDEQQPQLLEEARKVFKTINPYMTTIYGGKDVHLDKLCEAEISFYTYKLKDARIKMLELVHLAEKDQINELVLLARQYLLRIAILKGDLVEANKQMDQITVFIQESKLYRYNSFQARSKSMLALSLRDTDEVHIRVKKNSMKKESRWELTRNGLPQARYLIQNHRYGDSIALLNSLDADFKPFKGYWLGTLYVKIFRAVAHARLGRKAAAMDDLYEAYAMTWGNKVITPFIECEADMRYLITIAREEAPERFDEEFLDVIFVKSNNLSRHITQQRKQKLAAEKTIELTPRRVEILRDLAEGLTAIEIANKRNIKESTVRTHIKNICNDLGAINRANAVQIAISKGLI